ncbi:histidine kinase [Komagataeibacter rhaeticus]|uniref:GAF domain-containing protein n=1 Tax=Komagataeibacter rhaeticus TaxID=215221 RepID=A0A181CCT7_9PROT|nr:GAF domain-containing protein [Komagataeibacter rhaeticus]ATU71814.1 histidine kinase [Komagataeibacter xylinus]EGG75794.1 Protein ytsP [Gluconacetobacter sp. SXCC-1]KDU96423.1 histidine kinase [Komagataeibacter rhaeticus AF1]MBL7240077.1 GAF domain-containing protein [Komagataeibacter rhaeticus]PYD54761.1 histidine kinase [Komagataeibacter rhaeticus]
MAAPTRRLAPDDLLPTIASMLATETDLIANMANVAALIYEALPDLNWAGFYLWKDGQLVLGPFQGRVACTRIASGRGVCGTAARDRVTQVVPDVHDFPGHIACDAASASEIVVPVLAGDRLLGVLDVDSPRRDRFTHADQAMLEAVVALLVRSLPHK